MRYVLIVPSELHEWGERAIICETKEDLIARTRAFVKDDQDLDDLEKTGLSLRGAVEWVPVDDSDGLLLSR